MQTIFKMANELKSVLRRVKLNKNYVLRLVKGDEIIITQNGVDDPNSSFLKKKYPNQRKSHEGYKKNLKQNKIKIKEW